MEPVTALPTAVRVKEKPFYVQAAEVCIKAAAATVGVLGAIAIIGQLADVLDRTTSNDEDSSDE